MPAANPARPEAYTAEQWDAACAIARRKWSGEWENPPYAGQADPDGWRLSQCYMVAFRMFPEVVHLKPSEGPRDIPKDTVDTVYQMEITEGMQMVDQVIQMYRNYDFDTEVLVASVRSPMHIQLAAEMGADIATIPFKVMQQMTHHPLTDKGIKAFMDDWNKAQKK